MRKVIFIALIASLAMPFESCKKGDGDPGLSLRSRKGRVTGEWKLTRMEEEKKKVDDAETHIVKISIEGTSITETHTEDGVSHQDKGKVNAYTYTFDKLGKFTLHSDITMEYDDHGRFAAGYDEDHIEVNTKTDVSGTWNFLGKVDEFKNKERMILNLLEVKMVRTTKEDGETSTVTTTQKYGNGVNSIVWKLNTLKNKELKSEWVLDETQSFSITGGASGSIVTTGAGWAIYEK